MQQTHLPMRRMTKQGFSFTTENFKIIKTLRANKDIVILRPDKGQGVVLMKRTEYIQMLQILDDDSKFKKVGKCSDYNNTGKIERSMQTLLLRLHKAGEIPEKVYKDIRPTGSTRPMM